VQAPSNWLTAAVSGLALIGSALSLWESTFKHPEIKVYVSENIQYTRDPYEETEVIAVPITIANSGARDGAVLSLQLWVKNSATGKEQIFKSAYTADAQYFGARDDVAARLKRPKIPFAPLAIAARGVFSGTVLFYRVGGAKNDLIEPLSKLEITLRVHTPPPSDMLERVFNAPPNVVTVKAEVPSFYPGALLSGDNAPLKVSGDNL
jgi:hypothetical protein